MKPNVLDEVAPAMRALKGNSLCIHARVDDKDSGFFGSDEEAIRDENIEIADTLVRKWKTLFDCAEVM